MKKSYGLLKHTVLIIILVSNANAIYHLPKEVTAQNTFDLFGGI